MNPLLALRTATPVTSKSAGWWDDLYSYGKDSLLYAAHNPFETALGAAGGALGGLGGSLAGPVGTVGGGVAGSGAGAAFGNWIEGKLGLNGEDPTAPDPVALAAGNNMELGENPFAPNAPSHVKPDNLRTFSSPSSPFQFLTNNAIAMKRRGELSPAHYQPPPVVQSPASYT